MSSIARYFKQRKKRSGSISSASKGKRVRRSSTSKSSTRKRRKRSTKRVRSRSVGGRRRGRSKRYGAKTITTSANLNIESWSFKYQVANLSLVTVPVANVEPTIYMYAGQQFATPEPLGICDVSTVRTCALASLQNTTLTNTYNAVKLFNQRITHDLVNQNNAPMRLTAYLCRARYDITYQSSQTNIKTIIGAGFGEQGLDVANPDANNTTLINGQFSPYDSPRFCQLYKIVRTKEFLIDAGGRKRFMIDRPKPILYNPTRLSTMTSAQDEKSGTRLCGIMKGFTFWLFQLRPSIGSDSTGIEVRFNTPLCLMLTKYQCNFTGFSYVTKQSLVAGIGTAAGVAYTREPFDEDYKLTVNT